MFAASLSKSAMERVYCRRRTEVLVQHGDEAELLGDAGGVQECLSPDDAGATLRTVCFSRYSSYPDTDIVPEPSNS